jgi:hypothetical protein
VLEGIPQDLAEGRDRNTFAQSLCWRLTEPWNSIQHPCLQVVRACYVKTLSQHSELNQPLSKGSTELLFLGLCIKNSPLQSRIHLRRQPPVSWHRRDEHLRLLFFGLALHLCLEQGRLHRRHHRLPAIHSLDWTGQDLV